MILNDPVTMEGRAVWRLFLRARSQMRLGPNGAIGLDFSPVFEMARGTGVCLIALAEWLPGMNDVLRVKIAEEIDRETDGGTDGS